MAQSEQDIQALNCADNVAILSLLHEVPELPSKDSAIDRWQHSHGYVLTFEDERLLSSTLGYLASVSDKSDYIPAVAIEQNIDGTELDLLIAVNRASYQDGQQTLLRMREGFMNIFAQLQEERSGMIFDAILAMCSDRISTRLRHSGRKKSKQSFKVTLQCAIKATRRTTTDGRSATSLNDAAFCLSANAAVAAYDKWTRHQRPPQLSVLVDAIHHLSKVANMEALLTSIPSAIMDPSLCGSLLNIIRKVARYKEAAGILCHLARKCTLIKRTRVRIIQLPAHTFRRVLCDGSAASFSTSVRRIMPDVTENDSNDVLRLLRTSESSASAAIEQCRRKTLSEGKVHAEVQIIFANLLASTVRPCRVVCSSKSACFLCNLFIRTYGKAHTPKSHGRLYPGWRLPLANQSTALAHEFNQRLEDYTRRSILTMRSRRSAISYPCPNESVLLTLPTLSTSTTHALLRQDSQQLIAMRRSLQVFETDEDSRKQSMQEVSQCEVQVKEVDSDHDEPRSCATILEAAAATSGANLLQVANGEWQDAVSIPSPISMRSHHHLVRGQMLKQTSRHHDVPEIYVAGELELIIDRAALSGSDIRGCGRSGPRYDLEWLDSAGRASKEFRKVEWIDADALATELVLDMSSVKAVIISTRGVDVKFRLRQSKVSSTE